MDIGLSTRLMEPLRLRAMEDGGGGYGGYDVGYDGGGSGGGIAFDPAPSPVSSPVYTTNAPAFDLSMPSLQAAAARGNVASDVLSAHQTYLTGIPVGRGGQYAISAQRRYGYATIQDAARAYLEGSGLRRLAESLAIVEPLPRIDPEPVPDGNGIVTQPEPKGEGNPFETLGDLADRIERIFAVGPTDTPAPVVVVGDATQQQRAGGGGGIGMIVVILAIGAGAFYWFYLRKRGGASG